MRLISLLFLLILSRSALTCEAHSSYPANWWKPVPEAELAPWEIGPQAADRSQNQVILSKRNELGMLSNFYAASFEIKGHRYASVEGFWQAMKYPENKEDVRNSPAVQWKYTRQQVEQMTGHEAKRAGDLASENMKKLEIKWISFEGSKLDYKGKDQQAHYDLIFAATLAKIQQNPEVRSLLLQTGELQLLPDHKQEENSPPAYRYFDIAMKIRDSLKASKVK